MRGPVPLICIRNDKHPDLSYSRSSWFGTVQQSKDVLQSLTVCQVSYFLEIEVEGITIFSL